MSDMELTHPPMQGLFPQCIKWPVCEADCSHSSTAKVKNVWSYTSTHARTYASSWCGISLSIRTT